MLHAFQDLNQMEDLLQLQADLRNALTSSQYQFDTILTDTEGQVLDQNRGYPPPPPNPLSHHSLSINCSPPTLPLENVLLALQLNIQSLKTVLDSVLLTPGNLVTVFKVGNK